MNKQDALTSTEVYISDTSRHSTLSERNPIQHPWQNFRKFNFLITSSISFLFMDTFIRPILGREYSNCTVSNICNYEPVNICNSSTGTTIQTINYISKPAFIMDSMEWFF